MSRSHASLPMAFARGAMLLVLALLSATLLAACMTTAESNAARVCAANAMDPMCSYYRRQAQEEREREAEREEWSRTVREDSEMRQNARARSEQDWRDRVAAAVSRPAPTSADPELAPLAGAWCLQSMPTQVTMSATRIIEITGEKRLTITRSELHPGIHDWVWSAASYTLTARLGDDGFYELRGWLPNQPPGLNDRVRSEGPGVLTYIDHFQSEPGSGGSLEPVVRTRTMVPCRPGQG